MTTKKGEMLSKMLVLAVNRHEGQFDKQGQPYILHPLKVMHYLKSDDEKLQVVAVAHDLIEDTKTTYVELRELGFPEDVIEAIRALTKIPGETYEEYKAKVKANPMAVKVKMADLRHNTDIRRLKGATEKDLERVAKYYQFYLELKALDDVFVTYSVTFSGGWEQGNR
jgi:GTP diphosphokinase / guanosine-3',5'-bis(diphosphate) 3'-diphosphatase